MSVGLVLWVSDRRLRVSFLGNPIEMRIPGRWRIGAGGVRPVAPGDQVRIEWEGNRWLIKDLLPRQNEFTRRAAGPKPSPQTLAANLDRVLVVASAANPTTPYGLVDRLLATAAIGKVPASVVVNKSDLVSPAILEEWSRNYGSLDAPLLFTSAITGEGVQTLGEILRDKTTLLAGSSGIGKSSLINRIHPGFDLKVGEVSSVTGKGKHVTSSALLHALPTGGWVIDTPGMRECAPWGLNASNLLWSFPEIAKIGGGCRFRNCAHLKEDDCEVRAALMKHQIPEERYRSYEKLMAEAVAGE